MRGLEKNEAVKVQESHRIDGDMVGIDMVLRALRKKSNETTANLRHQI